MVTARPRIAIILFNLGGPDSPEAIAPFLRNLFKDPAILRVPPMIRPFLARLIAARRVAPATVNYRHLGGKSPLLELTRAQADALEAGLPEWEVRCVIAMRYWHPFAAEAAAQVRKFAPDRILLLPLYPQYSTTTTGSSFSDWHEAAARAGLAVTTTSLCCWPTDPGYIFSLVSLLRATLDEARRDMDDKHGLRVLFSAHGLPQTIIDRGDPYQMQVERTAQAMVDELAIPGLDWRVCYQSRATPQQWLLPATDAEIEQAARDGVGLVVVPIAFISDHSETLVELDIDYRDLARDVGVPGYWRVPVPNSDPGFIAALADLARHALDQGPGLCSHIGGRFCPAAHKDCPHR